MKRNVLTAIAVKNAPDGKLQDGGGLILVKRGETGKWVYRYSHLGKRREMGLGPWPTVTLAAARKMRDGWAAMLAEGLDPITERDAQREAQKAERDKHDPTLASAAEVALSRVSHVLRDGGKRGRWMSPLAVHILPKLGNRTMSLLTPPDLVAVLRPIWKAKPTTAEKAVARLRIVFREARATGANCDPATVDTAKERLGPIIINSTPHAAVPWQEIPALWQQLDAPNMSDECLRWMILTIVREAGCMAARKSEVDGAVWTVPADRMKGAEGRTTAFRVPLAAQARNMVDRALEFPGDLLFPSPGGGSHISSAALSKRLRTIGAAGTPHGFRTSFRTWVQDTNPCDYEVAETIMAHKVDQKVQRAYARSDLLERRAPVMQAWADWVTGLHTQ